MSDPRDSHSPTIQGSSCLIKMNASGKNTVKNKKGKGFETKEGMMTAPGLVLEGARVGDTQRHTERLYPYLQRRQVSELRDTPQDRSYHPVSARLPGEVWGGKSPSVCPSPQPKLNNTAANTLPYLLAWFCHRRNRWSYSHPSPHVPGSTSCPSHRGRRRS